MPRKLLAAVIVVIAILCGWYLGGPRSVPAGQPALTALGTDATPFSNRFDAGADNVRLVLLLSPT